MNYHEAYKLLNTAQKEAVDSLDGPVMVIAGPGTGKTQVLALRIATILEKTDTPPNGILCLTFTRSGVLAMRTRLESYLGEKARDIKITTFHSFAIELIEKYYTLLGFDTLPRLLDESESVLLFDDILENNHWNYIRPRANPSLYFREMTSLISLLKKESISLDIFLRDIETEIAFLTNDSSSLSSRGTHKGELKKEVVDKIEGLQRTIEVVHFYSLYEQQKKEKCLMDYDDVLTYAVTLVTVGENVRADIYENFLYVLIDEHQDSSGIQNAFLKAVWQDIEKPNIFIVGDDRQLIYGFSGAELHYFTEFTHFFGKAKIITLVDNYRSSQQILSASDALLKSSLTKDVLVSSKGHTGSMELIEYTYPRDEIIAAGIYFKSQRELGVPYSECALLLPKNVQVHNAVEILQSMGIPVSSDYNVSLFSSLSFVRLKKVFSFLINPLESSFVQEILLDPFFGVSPLDAHTFLKKKKTGLVSFSDLLSEGNTDGLFKEQNSIFLLGQKLENWLLICSGKQAHFVVSMLGNVVLLDLPQNHKMFLEHVEIVRTCIHLVTLWEQKHSEGDFKQFLNYLLRLETYGQSIPIATFGSVDGVNVMTLHRSKGLEYEHVWIAHMNEEVLMSEKRNGFTLPETIKEKIHSKNIESVTRELYVALTRAKSHVRFSYAALNYKNVPLSLSQILQLFPKMDIRHILKEESEKTLLAHGSELFVLKPYNFSPELFSFDELHSFVKSHFVQLKVSVSMLNNFFECPWKWYFKNFLRLSEEKAISLVVGSVVHSCIEYIIKQKTLPSNTEVSTMIVRLFNQEGIYEKKELSRLCTAVEEIVLYWIETEYHLLTDNRVAERSLSFKDPKFPNLIMYGKIDLTETFSNGTIRVTDFKTGSEKTKNIIQKTNEEGRLSSFMRQLAMYAYLFKHVDKHEVQEMRLFFLEPLKESKHKIYSTYITNDILDMLILDIETYQNNVLDGTWSTRKCYYQSYGKEQLECPYCVRAKMIFGIE